jgi:tetratricopeptide (TPR) repeat protein
LQQQQQQQQQQTPKTLKETMSSSFQEERILSANPLNPTINIYNYHNDQTTHFSIRNPPSFNEFAEKLVNQDSMTKWRIAIAYYNAGMFDDFNQIVDTYRNQCPILNTAFCALKLSELFSSEHSQRGHRQFDEVLNYTLEGLAQDDGSGDNAGRKMIQNGNGYGSFQDNTQNYSQNYQNNTQNYYNNSQNKLSNIPDQTNTLYAPLLNIILSLLQFVRVTQSSTLEFFDLTKLKDNLPKIFYTNTASFSPSQRLQNISSKIDSTNWLLQVPSARQETLSIIKSTLLSVSTAHKELAPLCYIILGTVSLHEAQYTIAIRFFCLALASNPLLPPTVRLALGYCYYYKQQYHQAKMCFVRALNICLNNDNDDDDDDDDDDQGGMGGNGQILFENNQKNQCMIDSVLGLTVTELAILQLEIKNANNLINEYESKLFQKKNTKNVATNVTPTSPLVDTDLLEHHTLQQEQFNLISSHVNRIYHTLNNIIKLHTTTQIQHPILALYVVQIELTRRVCQQYLSTGGTIDEQLDGQKKALSMYLKFFQWDPCGSHLHEHLTILGSEKYDKKNEKQNEIFLEAKLDLSDLIIILENLTKHYASNSTTRRKPSPSDESTMYPVTTNPMVLIQGLLYLAHCYFLSHDFIAAEEAYSLASNKLNSSISVSSNQTNQINQNFLSASLATSMAAAGVTQQEQSVLYLDTMDTLRTICQLQTAKCLFICERYTHAATAINRALSSLPQSHMILQPNQSMYVNLEQYIYYQYENRNGGKFFGLAHNDDKNNENKHKRSNYVNIGGANDKVVKQYTDFELSVNMTYVQIMTAYYNQRRRHYTTLIQSKFSNEGQEKVQNDKKKEKKFSSSVQMPQSMPLLSVLSATCLYHHEQRLLIEQDDRVSNKTHLDETLHFLLNLSISAVIVDLSVVQDNNIILFGLFALLRLLNIDFGPVYDEFYPNIDHNGNFYRQSAKNNTKITELFQKIQLAVYKSVIIGQNNDSGLTMGSSAIDKAIFPLSRTHRYFSVSTWSNVTTLCSILCMHYQQFNTRSFTLQQSRLTQFVHKNKAQIYANHLKSLEHDENDENKTINSASLTEVAKYFPDNSRTNLIDFDSDIKNPFISLLLQYFPQSTHHILLGSPVPLTPTTTIDAAKIGSSGALGKNDTVSTESIIATVPMAGNLKEKLPFFQHASYLSLTTTIQHRQQNVQNNQQVIGNNGEKMIKKSPHYDWEDVSTPTALLFKDNIFTLVLTVALAATVVMSALEIGDEYKNIFIKLLKEVENDQNDEKNTSNFSSIVQKLGKISSNQLDVDNLQHIITNHQFIDTANNNAFINTSKPQFFNFFGLILPAPIPLHSIPVFESILLPMRTFFLTYPYDKYAPGNMSTKAEDNTIFNVFTYSLQSVKKYHHFSSFSAMSLQNSSKSLTMMDDDNDDNDDDIDRIIDGINMTPQQYHFVNFLANVVNTTSIAFTLSGTILSSHGTHIPLRLFRADMILQLHDLFVTIETIRQKIHLSVNFTQKSLEQYKNHLNNTNFGNVNELLSQNLFLISEEEIDGVQNNTNFFTQKPQKFSDKIDKIDQSGHYNSTFFHYVDFETDYMGLAVYFGHTAVAILRLLQDQLPERPILPPLSSLPANYYSDLTSPGPHSKLTQARYRAYSMITESNAAGISIGSLPGGFNVLDLSGFDDIGTILTTQSITAYLDVIKSGNVSHGNQFIHQPIAKGGETLQIFTGHLVPFFVRRGIKQQKKGNNFIFNSDCVLIGRNTLAQIETLSQEYGYKIPNLDNYTISNTMGLDNDMKLSLYIPRPIPSQNRLFARVLFIQLHFSHPHLVCSDGTLYSSIIPSLYPTMTFQQLTYVSNHWSWYNNQSNLSQPPPATPANSDQKNKNLQNLAQNSSVVVEPNSIFPYMYTHLYLHHQTIHQSATTRSERQIENILPQLAQQHMVAYTTHTPASLKILLLIFQMLLKFKKSEKDALKLQRLREALQKKEVSVNNIRAQIESRENGTTTESNISLDSLRYLLENGVKRCLEFKGDISKTVSEYKNSLFDLMANCNTILLPTQHDAIEYIQDGIQSRGDKGSDKNRQNSQNSLNQPNQPNQQSLGQKDENETSQSDELTNSSNILALIISITVSMNLLKEHITSTPVKDSEAQKIKAVNVQYVVRQLRNTLTKVALSNTYAYQFASSMTMYHNMAPLSLIFNPGRLHIPITANITSGTGPNPYNLFSGSNFSNFFPTSTSTVLSLFHLLSILNEKSNNLDDALFYSYTSAALNGYQKTLSLSQHPLWFIGQAAQIYKNDYSHQSEQIVKNITQNNKIIFSEQQNEPRSVELLTSFFKSYPTRSYLSDINKDTYTYNYLPSVIDCDLIHTTQLSIVMKKQNILPLLFLSSIKHSLLLQIITQNSLENYINFSQNYQITRKNFAPFSATILPYGKFDSIGFSTYLQGATPPNSSAGLLSYALQGLVQFSWDYSISTLNLATTMQQLAITMFRYYQQNTLGIGSNGGQSQKSINPDYLLFSIASLLKLQQPELHSVGDVTIRLTDPVLTQLINGYQPFNQIDNIFLKNTSLSDLMAKSKSNKSKQLFKSTSSLSPYDIAYTCHVSNFAASSLYSLFRRLTTSIFTSVQGPHALPAHLGILNHIPSQSLNLPLLYHQFVTHSTQHGLIPHRTQNELQNAENYLFVCDTLYGEIRVYLQNEQERQTRETNLRFLLDQRAKEEEAKMKENEQKNIQESIEKKMLAQLRAIEAKKVMDDFIVQKQEISLAGGIDGQLRDSDVLPTREKKSGRKKTKGGDSDGDGNDGDDGDDDELDEKTISKKQRKDSKKDKKSDKKSKKDKKDKKSRRKSSRRGGSGGGGGDDVSDDDDDDDKNKIDLASRTIHFGDDSDDDSDDDQSGFLRVHNDDGDGDDGDGYGDQNDENNHQNIDNSSRLQYNSKFASDDDDDDDDGEFKPSIKKARHGGLSEGGDDQNVVTIGQPTPISSDAVRPNDNTNNNIIDQDNNNAKKRFIIESDDE